MHSGYNLRDKNLYYCLLKKDNSASHSMTVNPFVLLANKRSQTDAGNIAGQFVCMQSIRPALPAPTRVRSKGQIHG